MNIREWAVHLVLIWLKAGEEGGGGVGEGEDGLKGGVCAKER